MLVRRSLRFIKWVRSRSFAVHYNQSLATDGAVPAFVRITSTVHQLQEECRSGNMPEKKTRERARKDAREGKAPTSQAGEFVHEEIRHIREGKHGARSTKQAIAIGLSKARRAGVKLPPPAKGKASEETRARAARDY